MRVLRTKGSDKGDWIPCLCTHKGQPYAILSHRWLEDSNHEVLFSDIEEIDKTTSRTTADARGEVVKNAQYAGALPRLKPGFKKLQGAAQQALDDGYEYIWVDTCCIDKNSSAELSEAINSMWTWYRASNICYAYLSDVSYNADKREHRFFGGSQWWRRGWTLQELLAPLELRFYSYNWTLIGHKKYMDMAISEITRIDPNVINGTVSPDSVSIAQRMSWASGRATTRIEDTAYSLMGLFGVNMPLLYGEGKNAFPRLQQEIMKDSDDETIFAWKDESMASPIYSGMLAAWPSAFASSRKVVRFEDAEHRAPYSMTNKGLSITLPLAQQRDGLFTAMLHCADPNVGRKPIGIYLEKVSETNEQYARVECSLWAEASAVSDSKAKTIYIKQVHYQPPTDDILGHFKDTIRLLRLIPTEDTSIVRATFVEARMETCRYTALSYTRGKSVMSYSIWVNSQSFQVDKKVFDYLRKARNELWDDLFWIDPICVKWIYRIEVDQIYRHATRVAVLPDE